MARTSKKTLKMLEEQAQALTQATEDATTTEQPTEEIQPTTETPTTTPTTKDTDRDPSTHDVWGNLIVPSNLKRANRVSVVADGDGFKATYYKTHEVIATAHTNDLPISAWIEHDPSAKDTTKLQLREDFRRYATTNADMWGVLWMPEDLRWDSNKRKPYYESQEDIQEDVNNMLYDDITNLIAKTPKAEVIKGFIIQVDSMTAKERTAKGTLLSKLGIEDGRYSSNERMAWFDIDVLVTLSTEYGDIYQMLKMELVSGQLKKPKMTQTAWNTEITKSIEEIAPKTTAEGGESK